MLTALVLVASLAVPSTSSASTTAAKAAPAAVVHDRAAVRLAQALPASEPSEPEYPETFVEQYLSYRMNPAALPAVREGQFLSILVSYACWPACGSLWGPVVMVKGAELTSDIASTWLISSLSWSAIAIFTVVGLPVLLAVPYLTTTATLNAIDVQLRKKAGPGVPGAPGKGPSQPDETPPPSLAY